ncbi:hypothetical protein L210DRAFT_3530959, partial [Boletus edulis BED1]|uniref:Uncharacterized protein n=1 Tax=Boletus edulis BED1 TaxID=1328754 RepID=A0AAD4BBL7_BOLED
MVSAISICPCAGDERGCGMSRCLPRAQASSLWCPSVACSRTRQRGGHWRRSVSDMAMVLVDDRT